MGGVPGGCGGSGGLGGGLGGGGGGLGNGRGGGYGGFGDEGGLGGEGFMSITTLDVLASRMEVHVPANRSSGEVDTQSTNWRTTSSEEVNVQDTTVARL